MTSFICGLSENIFLSDLSIRKFPVLVYLSVHQLFDNGLGDQTRAGLTSLEQKTTGVYNQINNGNKFLLKEHVELYFYLKCNMKYLLVKSILLYIHFSSFLK